MAPGDRAEPPFRIQDGFPISCNFGEAAKWTGESTKPSVINEALKEIMKNRIRIDSQEWRGKLNWR
jgi:hypothetical protein